MALVQPAWDHTREAQRLGHHWMGCEHLLLNVLADEDGLAARVLARHGVTLEFARRRTAELCGAGDPEVVGHTFSPRANVVMHLADIEAERLEHDEPTDAHLILAMLTEGEGVPNGLFRECGVDTDRLREDLLDALDVSGETRATYLRQRRATERRQRAADSRANGPPIALPTSPSTIEFQGRAITVNEVARPRRMVVPRPCCRGRGRVPGVPRVGGAVQRRPRCRAPAQARGLRRV